MGNYSIGDWKEKGNKFYVSGKEVIEDVDPKVVLGKYYPAAKGIRAKGKTIGTYRL